MRRSPAVRDGVEFIVEEGTGRVSKVGEPGIRNARVEFDLGTPRKFPFGASVDTEELADVYRLAAEALADGRRVCYRIETHRAENVDAALPMAEVGQTDRYRRLVALTPAPANGSSAPQRAQEARPPATAPDTGTDGPPPRDDPDGPASGRRGPRLAEPRPWIEHNDDGTPNLGSYAVGASTAMVELAHELLIARELAHEPPPLTPPPMPRVVTLARALLSAADFAQAMIRADRRVDRMDVSHTRARGAVRSALVALPVPFGAGEEERAKWLENLSIRAADLLAAGVALVDPPPPPPLDPPAR